MVYRGSGWPYLPGEQAEGHLRALLPILFLLAALETGQPHCLPQAQREQ